MWPGPRGHPWVVQSLAQKGGGSMFKRRLAKSQFPCTPPGYLPRAQGVLEPGQVKPQAAGGAGAEGQLNSHAFSLYAHTSSHLNLWHRPGGGSPPRTTKADLAWREPTNPALFLLPTSRLLASEDAQRVEVTTSENRERGAGSFVCPLLLAGHNSSVRAAHRCFKS